MNRFGFLSRSLAGTKNKPRLKAIGLSAALLFSAAYITGCASTAKGSSQSALVNASRAEAFSAKNPEGTVLAVIRYPAVVDGNAKEAYHAAYEKAAIGGRAPTNSDPALQRGIADSVIVKSNYFALSLYKEMAARLPEHGVLLSPHIVKLGPNGKLTSEPITQAESLPSVVSVDFATYSFPDPKKMMSSEPLTFGDLVTPLVTVRTDHRAAPATQGVLLASADLIGTAAGAGREEALEGMSRMQRGQFDTTPPELDFISYMNGGSKLNIATAGLSGDIDDNVALSYPLEKIKLDSTALDVLKSSSSSSIDPLERVFSDAMANRIVSLINDVDVDEAVMAGRAAAIAEFDPSLAALTFAGSSQADYQARARYAERLLDAQRKYLSVQSLRVFDGIHNGEMGVQMRDMILAEYNVLEKRRKLARQRDTAAVLSVLAAVGGVAAIASSDENSGYGNYALTNALIQSSIYAGTQAFSYKQQSLGVAGNYLSSIAPAVEQQTTVTVDLIDSNETITAIRYDDLKAKLQDLYTAKQRSLDTVATRCAFTAEGVTGTWMGACNGGQANGSGVGIVDIAGQNAIEYYGYAQNGRANGPGLMIVHEANRSYSMKGNFANGLAEGSIQLSQPGQADSFRTFSGGQNIGRATSRPISLFDNYSPVRASQIAPPAPRYVTPSAPITPSVQALPAAPIIPAARVLPVAPAVRTAPPLPIAPALRPAPALPIAPVIQTAPPTHPNLLLAPTAPSYGG